jgi:hypothetical protein
LARLSKRNRLHGFIRWLVRVAEAVDTICSTRLASAALRKKAASRRIPGLQEMVQSCMYLFRVLNNYLLRKPCQLARSLLRALQESRVRAAGKAIQDHSHLPRK